MQGQQTDCGSHRDAEGTDGQSVVEVTRETMSGFHHEGHEEHEECTSVLLCLVSGPSGRCVHEASRYPVRLRVRWFICCGGEKASRKERKGLSVVLFFQTGRQGKNI